jgi:hypothetical protein
MNIRRARLGRRVSQGTGCLMLLLGLLAAGCHAGSPSAFKSQVATSAPGSASGGPTTGSSGGSGPSSAAPAKPPSAVPPARLSVAQLVDLLQHVNRATVKFGLHDNLGCPMATLKVQAGSDGYLGVYHCLIAGRYDVRLATSTDLLHWAFRAVLDAHASQPTIQPLPDGSYLLAVEADNSGNPGPGRRWLRFQHYSSFKALLGSHPDRKFDAPHTVTAPTRGAEGTPNIYSATLRQGIARSRIEVGFHYLDHGLDRQARGTLTDFSSWSARPDESLDAALSNAGLTGKHGDRDSVTVGSARVTVLEAQDRPHSARWRVAVLEGSDRLIGILDVRTPGRSTSFANPTVSLLRLPSGQPGMVTTMYLHRAGSARKEAGEMIYFQPLPGVGAAS